MTDPTDAAIAAEHDRQHEAAPKTERTPGPYYFDQIICARRDDGSLLPVAIPAAHWTRDEVDVLVDLLNRGTHHDKLLAALKDCAGVIEDNWRLLDDDGCCLPDRLHGALDDARAAIAKAEERESGGC